MPQYGPKRFDKVITCYYIHQNENVAHMPSGMSVGKDRLEFCGASIVLTVPYSVRRVQNRLLCMVTD